MRDSRADGKLRRCARQIAGERALQQLGTATGDCLAASGKVVLRTPPDDRACRVQHVLRRVIYEHAGKRDGQSTSLCDGQYVGYSRGNDSHTADASEWLAAGYRRRSVNKYGCHQPQLSSALRDDLE